MGVNRIILMSCFRFLFVSFLDRFPTGECLKHNFQKVSIGPPSYGWSFKITIVCPSVSAAVIFRHYFFLILCTGVDNWSI